MKLINLTLENFRCYKEAITIAIDDLTLFIGKNDSGKSAVLEALEIFFNNDVVTIDNKDSHIENESNFVSITCEFSEFPEEIVLDATLSTKLSEEYLLTRDGTLKIQKRFNCGLKGKPKVETAIIANHPNKNGVHNLLELKEAELKKLVIALGIEDAPQKGNSLMRKFLWAQEAELEFSEKEVSVDKEDSKKIWGKIESHLPLFALFQSDRSSTDSDSEVQNPLKTAISTAISEVEKEIESIQGKVEERVMQIVAETHEALKSIDENLAKQITPTFTLPTPAKWSGLFNVAMDTDKGIPLNKRGSGIRRMILVSFFKAEAERKLKEGNKRSIIYAIEEPETAQHPNNQKILMESFLTISEQDGCQTILTSHSPGLVADLPANSIRFITRNTDGEPEIKSDTTIFGEVAEALGLVPDSRVKAIICVEGPTDIPALKSLSKAMHNNNSSLPDLSSDDRFAFISLGGSSLKHWVTENYLRGINLPEIHIYDNDVSSYQKSVDEVNSRGGKNWATLTNKREIESYLHKDAIKLAYEGVEMEIDDEIDVPKVFGEKFSTWKSFDGTMGANKSKSHLTKAFHQMTSNMISDRNATEEIEGWLLKMNETVAN